MAKKYIDADTLFSIFEAECWVDNSDRDIAEELLLSAPAADFVEVVRCKDCKHFTLHSVCTNRKSIQTVVNNYDYCSYGERKDGEN